MYYQLLKSTLLFRVIWFIPLFYVIYTLVFATYSANPTEFYLLVTGNSAMYFYLATIYISPLAEIPPLKKTSALLLKHRKGLGIACFVYAFCHLLIHILDAGSPGILAQDLEKPFILVGVSAFIILLVLTVTSFRSLIKLSGKRWKQLHRITYIIPFLIAWHITVKDKGGDPERALLLFVPLLVLQSIRFWGYLNKVKRKQALTP